MAGIWAKENALDDAVLLNEHGCVCEATSSNIFIVKDDNIFTPPLSEGCVAGIMRSHVLSLLKQQQFMVHESLVTIEQLQQADAVFLTNAISGLTNIFRFEDTVYRSQFSL
jgi:branched-chain amino acid aminotransferase